MSPVAVCPIGLPLIGNPHYHRHTFAFLQVTRLNINQCLLGQFIIYNNNWILFVSISGLYALTAPWWVSIYIPNGERLHLFPFRSICYTHLGFSIQPRILTC